VRTVYLGTTEFAASVLARLAGSAHRPALVVTRPDRPKGRGRRLASPPVADTARELGIELEQPADVNVSEARERIAAAQPEAVTLCAFGALIGEELLDAHEWFNVHPSLLPRWRGAAPVERAIQAGDEQTGVSIMGLVEELDAGPVYLAGEEPVRPDDTYGTLAPRLAELAGDLLVRALDERPEPREQPAEGVTYAEKISPEDRELDPARGAEELARTVRALTPHIGAWVSLGDDEERLGVRAARPVGEPGLRPGELAARDSRLLLGTSGGALELLEVQPPGKRPMSAADYLRGHNPVSSQSTT
jgi:methionyl-tRNA formyltransferase